MCTAIGINYLRIERNIAHNKFLCRRLVTRFSCTNSQLKALFFENLYPPRWHTTLFQRSSNVIWTLRTSDRRCNNVVCHTTKNLGSLLEKKPRLSFWFANLSQILLYLNEPKFDQQNLVCGCQRFQITFVIPHFVGQSHMEIIFSILFSVLFISKYIMFNENLQSWSSQIFQR